MKIKWEKIVNNAISTLIATVFVGAAIIVWNGATSVDKKVTAAKITLEQTIDYTKKAVELVQSELVKIKEQNSNLVEAINTLKETISPTNVLLVATDQKISPKNPPLIQAIPTNDQLYFSMPNLPQLQQDKSKQESKVEVQRFHRSNQMLDVSQLPPVTQDYIQKQLPPIPTISN
jgi:hypothetical protein